MTKPSDLPYRPCVGVMLTDGRGGIFTGSRIDREAGEAWQMPQGGIDDGEDPRTTALRELEEETGIKPHLVDVIAETPEWHYYDLPDEMVGTIWKGRYAGQRQKWFSMRFLGSDADVAIDTAHPEFKAWRWAEAHTLVDLAVPFKRALYADVLAVLLGQKG